MRLYLRPKLGLRRLAKRVHLCLLELRKIIDFVGFSSLPTSGGSGCKLTLGSYQTMSQFQPCKPSGTPFMWTCPVLRFRTRFSFSTSFHHIPLRATPMTHTAYGLLTD